MGVVPFILISDISHIGPFVFTHHLLPLLKDTANAAGSDVRIVNVSHNHACRFQIAPGHLPMLIWQVSSSGHRIIDSNMTRFDNLEDFNAEFASAFYPGFSRYCKCSMLKINIQATNS